MSGRAYSCGLYLPGHDVHWIQAKLAARCEPHPKTGIKREATAGELLEVRPDGLVIIEVEGEVRRLWNHDSDRLKRLVARNRGEISHQPGFNLLRTRSGGGSYLFYVAEADSREIQPCPPSAPTGTLVELLKNAGGFSIRGREALGWVDPERRGEAS